MSCIDCRNPTLQHWTRCETCAINYCRYLMSDGLVPYEKSSIQHFRNGMRVIVSGDRQGTVKRKKLRIYRIVFDDGSTADVDVKELKSA